MLVVMGIQVEMVVNILKECDPVTTRNASWLRSIKDVTDLGLIGRVGDASTVIASYISQVRPRTWSPPDIGLGYVQFIFLHIYVMPIMMGMRVSMLLRMLVGCGPVLKSLKYTEEGEI